MIERIFIIEIDKDIDGCIINELREIPKNSKIYSNQPEIKTIGSKLEKLKCFVKINGEIDPENYIKHEFFLKETKFNNILNGIVFLIRKSLKDEVE